MSADLFISYAWTSDQHRQWVRMLAANVRALGYDVLVDSSVDYGNSLSGFMHRVVEARRVLLIVDENYVQRADNHAGSGVAVENQWISGAYADQPPTWLSVLFKDNRDCALPKWLTEYKPKGHWFNADAARNDFPGSEQVIELWRWIEDLPSYQGNATPIATLRKRSARLERIDHQRDPANWRNPAVKGEVHFQYSKAPKNTFWLGHSTFQFAFTLTGCDSQSVYVYADHVKAVGLVRSSGSSDEELAAHLSPARTITAGTGQSVVLLNEHGLLCRVEINRVQPEASNPHYVEPYVDFCYEVIDTS